MVVGGGSWVVVWDGGRVGVWGVVWWVVGSGCGGVGRGIKGEVQNLNIVAVFQGAHKKGYPRNGHGQKKRRHSTFC